jgi:hypothetical protein
MSKEQEEDYVCVCFIIALSTPKHGDGIVESIIYTYKTHTHTHVGESYIKFIDIFLNFVSFCSDSYLFSFVLLTLPFNLGDLFLETFSSIL